MASNTVDLKLSDAGSLTSCETTVVYSKCYLAWAINSFTHLRFGKDDYVESCVFSNKDALDDLKFQLILYPNGNQEAEDDIVLKLKLVTDDSDVRALVKYSCCICYKGQTEKACCEKSGEVFMTPGSYSKNISLVRRSDLLKRRDELLPKDRLTIGCKISSSYREDTKELVPQCKS